MAESQNLPVRQVSTNRISERRCGMDTSQYRGSSSHRSSLLFWKEEEKKSRRYLDAEWKETGSSAVLVPVHTRLIFNASPIRVTPV